MKILNLHMKLASFLILNKSKSGNLMGKIILCMPIRYSRFNVEESPLSMQ